MRVVVKRAGDPLLNVARFHTARKIYPSVTSARFSRGPARLWRVNFVKELCPRRFTLPHKAWLRKTRCGGASPATESAGKLRYEKLVYQEAIEYNPPCLVCDKKIHRRARKGRRGFLYCFLGVLSGLCGEEVCVGTAPSAYPLRLSLSRRCGQQMGRYR